MIFILKIKEALICYLSVGHYDKIFDFLTVFNVCFFKFECSKNFRIQKLKDLFLVIIILIMK